MRILALATLTCLGFMNPHASRADAWDLLQEEWKTSDGVTCIKSGDFNSKHTVTAMKGNLVSAGVAEAGTNFARWMFTWDKAKRMPISDLTILSDCGFQSPSAYARPR